MYGRFVAGFRSNRCRAVLHGIYQRFCFLPLRTQRIQPENTDCFLPINEYCRETKNTKQFIADIMLNLQDKIIDESLILHSQEKKEGSFQLKARKRKKKLRANIEQKGFKQTSVFLVPKQIKIKKFDL